MRFIDWFAGIGGFRLGLEAAGGFECVAHSEIDPYAERVYQRHWPGSVNLGDIRPLDPRNIPEAELWCGGFPCQPFSVAGKRRGDADERNLWPAWYDLIRVVRPRHLLAENVPGLLAHEYFGVILGQLSACGYDAEWKVIGADDVGAPHRRKRLWIFATLGDPECAERRAHDSPRRACREHALPQREEGPGGAGVSGQGDGPHGDVADAEQRGTRMETSRSGAFGRKPRDRPEPEMVRQGDGEAITEGTRASGAGVADADAQGRLQQKGSVGQERGWLGNGCFRWPPGWSIDPADVPESVWIDDVVNAKSERRGEGRAEHEVRGGRDAAAESGHVADAEKSNDIREPRNLGYETKAESTTGNKPTAPVAHGGCPCCGADRGPTPPVLGRVAHGIPNRVDRLRCLGNAVVPQVVEWIGRRIMETR